jgi:hypothetical protein
MIDDIKQVLADPDQRLLNWMVSPKPDWTQKINRD